MAVPQEELSFCFEPLVADLRGVSLRLSRGRVCSACVILCSARFYEMLRRVSQNCRFFWKETESYCRVWTGFMVFCYTLRNKIGSCAHHVVLLDAIESA